MTEQLALTLTVEPEPDDYQPPAPHVSAERHGSLGGYSAGCRCHPCSAAHSEYQRLYRRGKRKCQHCATIYEQTTGGATKFCGQCIADGVYQRHYRKRKDLRSCAHCGEQYPLARIPGPWNICPECRKQPVFRTMMGALGNHHAPLDVVLGVMDWPYCANQQCGAWLLERVGIAQTRNFAIDHDHTCCPGHRSCGQCIRGVICRACNQAMPHTLDTMRARGILEYLTRAAHSEP